MRSFVLLLMLVLCLSGHLAAARPPDLEGTLERCRTCDNSCRICHPADGRRPEPAHHLHPSCTPSLLVILADGPWVRPPGALGGDIFLLKANGEIWGLPRAGTLWLAIILPVDRVWCALLTEGNFQPVAVTRDGEVWCTAGDGYYLLGDFAAHPFVAVGPRN